MKRNPELLSKPLCPTWIYVLDAVKSTLNTIKDNLNLRKFFLNTSPNQGTIHPIQSIPSIHFQHNCAVKRLFGVFSESHPFLGVEGSLCLHVPTLVWQLSGIVDCYLIWESTSTRIHIKYIYCEDECFWDGNLKTVFAEVVWGDNSDSVSTQPRPLQSN